MSPIARQLPLSPKPIAANGIERALDVAISRTHDANVREHRRATVVDD
jgi:hypothetical protein